MVSAGATSSRTPLAKVTRSLIAVCAGREPPDLVTGGRRVGEHTREIEDGVDVVSRHNRVALVADAANMRGPETEIVDAEGACLVPGLLDTHVHVASVMVTVTLVDGLELALVSPVAA